MSFYCVDKREPIDADTDKKTESGSQSSQNLLIFSQESIISQDTNEFIKSSGIMESNSDTEMLTVPITQPDLNLGFFEIDTSTLLNNPGRFAFQLSFGREERISKSCSWTYSKNLHKVYVNVDSACPFRLSATKDLPSGSFIRASLYYKKSEDFKQIPVRCPIHRNHTDPSNIGAVAPSHLIRSDLSLAKYETDWETARSSVVVPYLMPEGGMDFTTYIFKVMCLTSCPGGMERRPTNLLFTLENKNFCLGRQNVEIRICACPGRDRLNDEKKFLNQTVPTPDVFPPLVESLKRSVAQYKNGEHLNKRQRHDDEMQGRYEIKTTNKKLIKLFTELEKSLGPFFR